MVDDADRDRLLEIYKLHANLANHVSERRERANRLYVSLFLGLILILSALIRFGDEGTLESLAVPAIGLLGVAFSASWIVVLRSYSQLNREKFRVLHDLEEELPYQFFQREWDPKEEGGKSNDYLQLTRTESILPLIFLAVSLVIVSFTPDITPTIFRDVTDTTNALGFALFVVGIVVIVSAGLMLGAYFALTAGMQADPRRRRVQLTVLATAGVGTVFSLMGLSLDFLFS